MQLKLKNHIIYVIILSHKLHKQILRVLIQNIY